MLNTGDCPVVSAEIYGRSVISGQPLLTIGIPTYNRRPYLQRCVESIMASLSGCDVRIELLISDNASNDDTQTYLDSLLASLPASDNIVRIIRQANNIGAERNFRALTKAASGRFIWVIGDDDLLEIGAVPLVIEKIMDGASSIVCNYSVWDKDLARLIAARGLNINQDARVSSKNSVMSLFGLNIGYISSVVMNRALFLTLDDSEYESLTSYGFPFMYAAYVGLHIECKLAYISEPIVVNRSGNSGGYDWYRYFVLGSSLIFDRLVQRFDYSRTNVNMAKTRIIHQYVMRELAARRLSGAEITGIPALLFKNYWFLPSFWLFLVPIILMPRRIIGVARNLFKRMR
jgi:abequosyltransferase